MENIQEQIGILVKLQEVDGQIYKLKDTLQKKPAEKEALKEEFAQKGDRLKQREEELKAAQLKRKDKELDLEGKEKDIKKYQAQLLQLKTNKEYVTMQREIEGLKADKSALEDSLLELMDVIDRLKVEVQKEKENFAAEEKKLKEETVKIDQEVKQIEEKVAGLEGQRGQISVNVDKTLLSKYERILKAKEGLALVPAVGESCGGCHQTLPPQVINEMQMKDRIVTCDFCARLLYWPEQKDE
ncbi:MAG: hypothetical protein JW869_05685 [Candidatus Omnitrophica bacterium]|nr:hypothetical protein [Candidatus Omnitrophota bacterium]